MRSAEQHGAHVISLASRLPAVRLPPADSVGMVLAGPLTARVDVPPFDNSAMDGFAVRSADLEASAVLDVVGDAPAGVSEPPAVRAGTAVRIMTGAPLPAGADCVVPVELTDHSPGDSRVPATVRITERVAVGRHIRRRGEDNSVGDIVLAADSPCTPAVASAAVSLGHDELTVTPRPRIAVLSTGTELVAPGAPLRHGQIPDSNSTLLATLARQFGAEVMTARSVPDDPDKFRSALAEALDSDLVVTTGGVSQGAFEVVRQVTGDDLEFTTVRMQPGKPQSSGLLHTPDGRSVPMLGLPGNPVSAYVSAWAFLRPLIAVLAGRDPLWEAEPATATSAWDCKPGRTQFVPVQFRDGGVVPVHRSGFGSHRVASLARSRGLVVVDEATERVEVGDEVRLHRTDREYMR